MEPFVTDIFSHNFLSLHQQLSSFWPNLGTEVQILRNVKSFDNPNFRLPTFLENLQSKFNFVFKILGTNRYDAVCVCGGGIFTPGEALLCCILTGNCQFPLASYDHYLVTDTWPSKGRYFQWVIVIKSLNKYW